MPIWSVPPYVSNSNMSHLTSIDLRAKVVRLDNGRQNDLRENTFANRQPDQSTTHARYWRKRWRRAVLKSRPPLVYAWAFIRTYVHLVLNNRLAPPQHRSHRTNSSQLTRELPALGRTHVCSCYKVECLTFVTHTDKIIATYRPNISTNCSFKILTRLSAKKN